LGTFSRVKVRRNKKMKIKLLNVKNTLRGSLGLRKRRRVNK
jgi:hypothetical protein